MYELIIFIFIIFKIKKNYTFEAQKKTIKHNEKYNIY
jgi:hypothetical protein